LCKEVSIKMLFIGLHFHCVYLFTAIQPAAVRV
jgi:hypothetical protein